MIASLLFASCTTKILPSPIQSERLFEPDRVGLACGAMDLEPFFVIGRATLARIVKGVLWCMDARLIEPEDAVPDGFKVIQDLGAVGCEFRKNPMSLEVGDFALIEKPLLYKWMRALEWCDANGIILERKEEDRRASSR